MLTFTRLRRLHERLEGEVDVRRLAASSPWFADAVRAREAERATLAPYHAAYVADVSSEGMALSLDAATLLSALVRVRRPRHVLDLGSGFSSAVVRAHLSTGAAGHVTSVDDDAAWLERTRAYLTGRRLPVDDLITYDAFRSAESEPYDLVLHDLGSMETRADALSGVLDRCARGAVVLLDDVHKGPYREHVRRTLRARRLPYHNVHPLTYDHFGRFAFLVTIPA